MRILLILISVFTCNNVSSIPEYNATNSQNQHQSMTINDTYQIVITIGSKEFMATLYDNLTAKAFIESLPVNFKMKDLNNNEKYFNLSKNLPTETTKVKSIHSGDLMLWQSNTIVLFYKDFNTTYSYSKIGKIEDPAGLAKAVGAEDIEISFRKK